MTVRRPACPALRQRDPDRDVRKSLARGKTRASGPSPVEMALLKPDKSRNDPSKRAFPCLPSREPADDEDRPRIQGTRTAHSVSRPRAKTGFRHKSRAETALARSKAATAFRSGSGNVPKTRLKATAYDNIGRNGQPRY